MKKIAILFLTIVMFASTLCASDEIVSVDIEKLSEQLNIISDYIVENQTIDIDMVDFMDKFSKISDSIIKVQAELKNQKEKENLDNLSKIQFDEEYDVYSDMVFLKHPFFKETPVIYRSTGNSYSAIYCDMTIGKSDDSYCYFNFLYFADNWLFIKKATIMDKDNPKNRISFDFDKEKTDMTSYGYIMEDCYYFPNQIESEKLRAFLVNCVNPQLFFTGSEYSSEIIDIIPDVKQAMIETFDYCDMLNKNNN